MPGRAPEWIKEKIVPLFDWSSPGTTLNRIREHAPELANTKKFQRLLALGQ
jgi:hypothetical protein